MVTFSCEKNEVVPQLTGVLFQGDTILRESAYASVIKHQSDTLIITEVEVEDKEKGQVKKQEGKGNKNANAAPPRRGQKQIVRAERKCDWCMHEITTISNGELLHKCF